MLLTAEKRTKQEKLKVGFAGVKLWVEDRGGKPAVVKSTHQANETGILRIDMPGYGGEESLEEISWEEFFEKFDESGLAFVCQDTTKEGQKSNFNKLVSKVDVRK